MYSGTLGQEINQVAAAKISFPAPRAYVISTGLGGAANSVTVVNTATDSIIASIPNVGTGHAAIAALPDGSKIYITGFGNGIAVIDAETNLQVTSISLGGTPGGLAVTPDGSALYATTNQGSGTLVIIDTRTNAVLQSIPLTNASLIAIPGGS